MANGNAAFTAFGYVVGAATQTLHRAVLEGYIYSFTVSIISREEGRMDVDIRLSAPLPLRPSAIGTLSTKVSDTTVVNAVDPREIGRRTAEILLEARTDPEAFG